MKQTFSWFFDISTSATSMQIITVNAGGSMVRERLQPFFAAYKYFKLGKVRMTFVPASTLPVDPTGLSMDPDEPTVDPRDQLNPGLTRITNGEDFLNDITGWTSTQQELVYQNMLLDRRWYKFQLQAGLKRSAVPLYWQVGQLHQDYYPGATVNIPTHTTTSGGTLIEYTSSFYASTTASSDYTNASFMGYLDHNNSDPRGLFQVGHKGKLGWLPTDALIQRSNNARSAIETDVANAAIPSIEVFKVILPKAYKTKYYYRVYCSEDVYFKEPVTYTTDLSGISYGSLDRFIRPGRTTPIAPGVPEVMRLEGPTPPNNGHGKEDSIY